MPRANRKPSHPFAAPEALPDVRDGERLSSLSGDRVTLRNKSRSELARMLDDFDPDELTRLRTEVERLRNELFVAQAHLTEAKSDCAKPEQQKIVSAFGHDARSSLALVLGWAELLVHDRLTPEKRQLAYDTIYDAGWRIEASLRWFEKSLESRAK